MIHVCGRDADWVTNFKEHINDGGMAIVRIIDNDMLQSVIHLSMEFDH